MTVDNFQVPVSSGPLTGHWPLATGGGKLAAVFACLRGSADADAALSAIARDFSPRVMRVAPGELLADVSGLGRLIGTSDDIARELRRAVMEAAVDAAVAIAATQTAARVLARVPGATAIAGLPVTILRDLETLPPATNVRDRERPYETLARWGIATLGDLAALPASDLSSRLGRRGVALQRLAHGHDPRPFVPDAGVPRFIERLELEWPIDALEPLSFVFARLLDPLSSALERADRGAAAIRLELRLTDRSVDRRVLQLPAPMRDARVLRTLLLLDLESGPPCGTDGSHDVSIDVVTIEIDPAPSRITQFSLLERAVPSPETVSTLVARLSALVGESRVGSPRVLDTHQPGAFAMEGFVAVPVAARGETMRPDDAAPHEGRAYTLRRQRIPPAIRVNVSGGRPVYLAPSRRGIPSGAVVQSAGPWRASGGWWMKGLKPRSGEGGLVPPKLPGERGLVSPKLPGERGLVSPKLPGERGLVPPKLPGERGLVPPKPRSGEGGWDRSEWDVALARGEMCRIFQDRATGCWFFDGLYD